MAKMGRPQKEIDQKQFEKLCGLQCPLHEIASWFECSEDTIERWCKRTYSMTFADAYKIHSAQGKISLRRFQFKQAERSTAMAIWLGKQWLDQKEQMVIDANIKPEVIKEIEDMVFDEEATNEATDNTTPVE